MKFVLGDSPVVLFTERVHSAVIDGTQHSCLLASISPAIPTADFSGYLTERSDRTDCQSSARRR